MNNISEKIA